MKNLPGIEALMNWVEKELREKEWNWGQIGEV